MPSPGNLPREQRMLRAGCPTPSPTCQRSQDDQCGQDTVPAALHLRMILLTLEHKAGR